MIPLYGSSIVLEGSATVGQCLAITGVAYEEVLSLHSMVMPPTEYTEMLLPVNKHI